MGVIDDYINGFEGEVRSRLEQVRDTVRAAVPGATELISYAMPTFDLDGVHLVHFAGYKNHVGLYPTPQGITVFEDELAPYKRAKGSVQFPHDQPLPLDLIGRIALARVADVQAKLALKPKKKPKEPNP